MEISIIIVAYRNKGFLTNCLDSLYKNTQNIDFEVIVVSNDTNLDSTGLYQYPKLRYLGMGYNAGFSRANNYGIRHAKGKYILLLNADTLIPDVNILLNCVFRMNRNSDIAACGVYQQDALGNAMPVYRSFAHRRSFYLIPQTMVQWFIREKTYPDANQADWLSGAFLMVRREAIEQAGLMDEDFFLYAEDVEWCYRLGKTGRLVYFPDLHITHLENPANPHRATDTSFINRFGTQIHLSNLLWIRKQYGLFAYLFLIVNYLAVCFVFFSWKVLLNILRGKKPFSQLENQKSFAKKLKIWLGFFKDTVFLRKQFYKIPTHKI